MKKPVFPILMIVFCIFGTFLNPVLATADNNPSMVPDNLGWGEPVATGNADCFDYYNLHGITANIGVSKATYNAGETVSFSGFLENKNKYPVVDTYLFVRVSRENTALNEETDGYDIVDELVPVGPISIAEGSNAPIKFSWQMPKDLARGRYHNSYFVSVGKRFNLGGLPFTNEVIAGNSTFSVEGEKTAVFLDRAGTKVNGEKYVHIAFAPVVGAGSQVLISQPIINTFESTKTAEVKYDLFYWDSLNEVDKISSTSEVVELKAGELKILNYAIEKVERSVYYLRITSLSGEQKSVVNIRLGAQIEGPRINYPGISKFPLRAGDDFDLFSCFHNTSDRSTNGALLIRVLDRKNEELGNISYSGIIPGAMSAEAKTLNAKQDYDYLKIIAQMKDKNGNVVDEYEVVYDCAQLKSNACGIFPKVVKVNTEDGDNTKKALVSLLVAVLAIGIIFFFKNRKRVDPLSGFNVPTTMIIFFLLTFSLMVPFSSALALSTRSPQVNSNYWHGWMSNSEVARGVDYGNIVVTHTIDVNKDVDSTPVTKGSKINFSYNPPVPVFNRNGGNWDTPNGRWCSGDNSLCNASGVNISRGSLSSLGSEIWGSGCLGYVYWTGVKPAITYTSSNPSVLSCAGSECTAVSAGTAIVTADIDPTKVRYWASIYSGNCEFVDGAGNLSHGDNYLNTSESGGYFKMPDIDAVGDQVTGNSGGNNCTLPAYSCDAGYSCIREYAGFSRWMCRPNTNKNRNKGELPATTATWNVTVMVPPPCSSATGSDCSLECGQTKEFAIGTYNLLVPDFDGSILADFEIWGGGGGGGGDGSGSTVGGAGGNSSIDVLSAGGGKGGTMTTATALGGTASGGNNNILGENGFGRTSCSVAGRGGSGANTAGNFGTADASAAGVAGNGGIPGGGGGGGYYSTVACASGGGGGGGYAQATKALTSGNLMTLIVGAGGNAGAGAVGGRGGAGGAGKAKVLLSCTPAADVCNNGDCEPSENSVTCPEDCTCASLNFNSGTSSVTPNTIKKEQNYTIKCDYGVSGIDAIRVVPASGTCAWGGYIGTVANFNCTAGTGVGSFSAYCYVVGVGTGGTTSDYCPRPNSLVGNLIVEAKCPDTVCDLTETSLSCEEDCGPVGFELEKSGDPVVYIDSNLTTGTRKSSTIKIKITPDAGFNKNVTLSIDGPATPDVPSLTSNFPKTIAVSADTETSFYVNVSNDIQNIGTKKLVIKGVSSGAIPVTKMVDIFVKVIDVQYENK